MRRAVFLLAAPLLAWAEEPTLHLTVLRPLPAEAADPQEIPTLHLTVLRPQKGAEQTRQKKQKRSHSYTFAYALGLGYRDDGLGWHGKLGPQVRTREKWHGLKGLQLAGEVHMTTPIRLTFQGGLAYTWVLAGRATRSDAISGFDRGALRFPGDADDGHVFEVTGGFGYRFASTAWLTRPYLEPIVGYAYRKQNLHAQDFAGFNGHYRYRAEWYGPWLGLRLGIEGQDWGLFGQWEYHFASYRAEGDWKGEDREIRHNADGFGVVVRAGGSYRILDQLALRLSFDFERWQTDSGIDRTEFSDGSSIRTRLKEVNWHSLGGNLAVEYQF